MGVWRCFGYENHRGGEGDMKDCVDEALFNEDIIRQCTLDSFSKRLWGAWKVLIGQAGVLLLCIKKEKIYRSPNAKQNS